MRLFLIISFMLIFDSVNGQNDLKVNGFYHRQSKHNYNNYDIYIGRIFSIPDTVFIELEWTKGEIIDSVQISSDQIKVINSNGEQISRLKFSRSEEIIGIKYLPLRSFMLDSAFIILHTQTKKTVVNFRMRVFDIGTDNFDTITELHIVKSVNPRIYVHRVSEHTPFALYSHPLEPDQLNKLYTCGDCIMRGKDSDTRSSGPLDISKLNSGLYYLAILGPDDRIKNIKIFIE